MSRSRKDGRNGGAHKNRTRRGLEVWTPRHPKLRGWSWTTGLSAFIKRATHRYERREARAGLQEAA